MMFANYPSQNYILSSRAIREGIWLVNENTKRNIVRCNQLYFPDYNLLLPCFELLVDCGFYECSLRFLVVYPKYAI